MSSTLAPHYFILRVLRQGDIYTHRSARRGQRLPAQTSGAKTVRQSDNQTVGQSDSRTVGRRVQARTFAIAAAC
eukprot:233583-Prorocentrum_minimum.AAC.1